ncbi:MAG TPA: uroporphyrinogen-III synthase [Allosphingosinicella sp.]
MSKLLILRPQPGADETAARAQALGLEPVVAPLFAIQALAWELPAERFDALLLTSANGARFGLRPELADLPCYAVGEATAEAAKEAGATHVITGPSDGAAAVDLMAQAGVKQALHLCGRDHVALAHSQVRITKRVVYAAEPVSDLPGEAAAALEAGALVLLHSPRAAALFASLVPQRSAIRIIAISTAAADAAGSGWAAVHLAERPRDDALLELAVRLCKTEPS